jgi:hypothetical protein
MLTCIDDIYFIIIVTGAIMNIMNSVECDTLLHLLFTHNCCVISLIVCTMRSIAIKVFIGIIVFFSGRLIGSRLLFQFVRVNISDTFLDTAVSSFILNSADTQSTGIMTLNL